MIPQWLTKCFRIQFQLVLQVLCVLLIDIESPSESGVSGYVLPGGENSVIKSNLDSGKLNYYLNQNKNWEQFQIEHIFNPDENPGYENWRGKEWRRWMFRMRNPKKAFDMGNSIGGDESWAASHKRRHGPANFKLQATLASMKHIEVVVIAKPEDVLTSFRGNLMQYGTKNQALVWSQWSFPTLIFQKAGRRLRIFDCGDMHIATRLLNSYPTYLHDFYPSQIRNPLGGHLRFPVNKRCTKIPQM